MSGIAKPCRHGCGTKISRDGRKSHERFFCLVVAPPEAAKRTCANEGCYQQFTITPGRITQKYCSRACCTKASNAKTAPKRVRQEAKREEELRAREMGPVASRDEGIATAAEAMRSLLFTPEQSWNNWKSLLGLNEAA